jgi:subfamily B ATP-binding cassette protein MsbA
VSPVQEVLHATLFVALLVGTIIFEGGVPLPALIAFLVLLQRMQPHLRNLESARAEIAASEGSVREVEWLLDPAGKPEPASGALAIDAFESGIEFRNVEFRYATRPDAAPALVDASFSIRAGRSTAVIGASGAGKSTIVNLLCRLCEPTGGEILVNHTRLADIDPWQWRRKIGLAGQDIELLEGSIAENIAFGAPEATREEIEQAAHIADADGFISELPDGYETDVGSRGISLSGGQRQRISLARALVRRPELLILDEATNAVDALSEASIIKRLRDLGSHMTVVVISHRPSTLASCDDGIVLDAGVVKESGPLESLRAYRSMFSARDSGSRDLR